QRVAALLRDHEQQVLAGAEPNLQPERLAVEPGRARQVADVDVKVVETGRPDRRLGRRPRPFLLLGRHHAPRLVQPRQASRSHAARPNPGRPTQLAPVRSSSPPSPLRATAWQPSLASLSRLPGWLAKP